MIDTIIFDVGNVLAEYDWKKYLSRFGFDQETNEKIAKAMFLSNEWNELDRSSLSDEDILDRFIGNAPSLEKEIRQVYHNMEGIVTAFPYAYSWIESLKEKGYKVYILSNYSRKAFYETEKELQFYKITDGAIFSFQVEMVKPEKEIYEELIKRYGIIPERAVFLDDLKANIEAAQRAGLHGIQVENKEQAEKELSRLGVEC